MFVGTDTDLQLQYQAPCYCNADINSVAEKVNQKLINYRQHNRQCTYNVTPRCVRATIVALEKQWVLHILNVYVALGFQYAMRMGHIVISGLPSSTIFIHIISQKAQFSGRKC